MLHILIASPYLPWPLTEGGRAAQYRTFEALRAACTFTLVVPVHSPAEEADARYFAGKFSNVTMEAVRCFNVAPPLTTRARLRKSAGRLLRAVFPPAKVPPPVPSAQTPGEADPFYPFNCLHPNFVAAVERHFIKGCDIFQAEFAQMLTLGPLLAGRVPLLFVHHQLHHVYARRFLEANPAAGANARYLVERMIQEEAAYLNSFESAIVFSAVDCQALNIFCPQLAVHVSPFPGPEEPLPGALTVDHAIKRLVFVASEANPPNVAGLRWFMKDVWPTIKSRMPDTSLEVIGKWSLGTQTSLLHHRDIHFVGFVPELVKALEHKIMIVPVWIGSGIRTKILAAWGAACPVVTTTVGAEGLPGQTGEHFIIADDAQTFADACIELSHNLAKLNRMAANGLDLVKKHYSLAAVRQTRLEVYKNILAAHRRKKPSPVSVTSPIAAASKLPEIA
jgi:hypothetical protein